VRLGTFAAEALAGTAVSGDIPEPDRVVQAIQFYLSNEDGAGAGWAYPAFLREREMGEEVKLEISIEDSSWLLLEGQARKQGVVVGKLLEHVILYYTAELDAGRVTTRILGDREQ
jgi:hypothetical protein